MIKIVIIFVVQHELTQSAREGMKKGRDFRLKTHLYLTTATTEGQDEKRIEYWYRTQFCRILKAFVCRINPKIVFYRLYYHILNIKYNPAKHILVNDKKKVCMSLFPNNKTIANFFLQQDFASAHSDKVATK